MTPVSGAPQGGTTIPHPAPTPSGTTTTTNVESPASIWTHPLDWLHGTPEVTKSTVTTKEPTTPGATTGNQSTTKAPITVHMQSPDGKTYSVNQEDVEASKAHGWKVIGG